MDLAIQEIQEFMESQIDLPDMTTPWAQHAGSLREQMEILMRVIETFGLGLQSSLKDQRKTIEDQLDDIYDLQETLQEEIHQQAMKELNARPFLNLPTAPSHSGWPDQIASAIPLTFFDTVGINPYSAFKQGSYRTDPRISSMRNRQSLTQGTLVRRFNNHQRAPSRTSVQDLSDANIKIAEMSRSSSRASLRVPAGSVPPPPPLKSFFSNPSTSSIAMERKLSSKQSQYSLKSDAVSERPMTEEPEEEEAPVERNPFQEILQKKLQAMGKVLTDRDELVSKGGESAMSLQIQRAARERMNRPTSDDVSQASKPPASWKSESRVFTAEPLPASAFQGIPPPPPLPPPVLCDSSSNLEPSSRNSKNPMTSLRGELSQILLSKTDANSTGSPKPGNDRKPKLTFGEELLAKTRKNRDDSFSTPDLRQVSSNPQVKQISSATKLAADTSESPKVPVKKNKSKKSLFKSKTSKKVSKDSERSSSPLVALKESSSGPPIPPPPPGPNVEAKSIKSPSAPPIPPPTPMKTESLGSSDSLNKRPKLPMSLQDQIAGASLKKVKSSSKPATLDEPHKISQTPPIQRKMTFQDEILARGQSKLKKTLTIETRSEPNLASSSFEQQEPDSRSTPDIHTPRALTFQEEILAKKLASAKNRPAPIVTKPMQPEPETFQSQLQARIKKRAEALASASASVASLSAARPTSAMEVFPESKPMPASSPKLERPSVTAKTEAQKDTEKSESIATKKEASEKLSVLEVTPDMIATVTVDFDPMGPGQLKFNKAEKIIVIDFKYAEGWAHVSSMDGQRVGIFPQAFLLRSL